MFKKPQNDRKYFWTQHVIEKMLFYGISEGRIKRIIRYPTRIEEGIAPNTVAVMCPYGTSPGGRQPYRGEIWVMYNVTKPKSAAKKIFSQLPEELAKMRDLFGGKQFKIITAWRYPGKSPERDPVPDKVMSEIREIL